MAVKSVINISPAREAQLRQTALANVVRKSFEALRADLDDRAARDKESNGLEVERTRARIDTAYERIKSLSDEVARIRTDASEFKFDFSTVLTERVDKLAVTLTEEVGNGLEEFDGLKDLTTEQIGLFAESLEKQSAEFAQNLESVLQAVERGDASVQELVESNREAALEEWADVQEQLNLAQERLGERVNVLDETHKERAGQLVADIKRLSDAQTAFMEQTETRHTGLYEKLGDEVDDIRSNVDRVNEATERRDQTLEAQISAIEDQTRQLWEDLSTQKEGLDERIVVVHQGAKDAVAEVTQQLESFRERVVPRVAALETLSLGKLVKEQAVTDLRHELTERVDDVLLTITGIQDAVTESNKDGAARDVRIDALVETLDKQTESLGNLDVWRRDTANILTDLLAKDVSKVREEMEEKLGAATGSIVDIKKLLENVVSKAEDLTSELPNLVTQPGLDEFGEQQAEATDHLTGRIDKAQDAADAAAECARQIVVDVEGLTERTKSLVLARESYEARILGTLDKRLKQFAEDQTQERATWDEWRENALADVSRQVDRSTAGSRLYTDEALDEWGRQIEKDIAGKLRENLLSMRPWTGDGPPYERLAYVMHNGGVWQCCQTTKEEPGASKHWVGHVHGINSIGLNVTRDGSGIAMTIQLSNGEVVRQEASMPTITYLKTWDPEATYRQWDSVLRNRNRYLAIVPNPKGDPAKSADWVLFAMAGPQGRKGDKGDPPTTEEIQRAYTAYLEQGEGIAFGRFRGGWKYRDNYVRSDVVVYQGTIMIAQRANNGEVPPSGVPGAMGNRDWLLLFAPPLIQMPDKNVTYGGVYVPGAAYGPYTQVQDEGWLMIANKPTSDRPSPQNAGPAYDVYDGAFPTDTITAKQLTVGQRYTWGQDGRLNGMRVYTVTGNSYRIYYIKDPEGTPIITEFVSQFTADTTGWRDFAVNSVVVDAGTVFDLYTMMEEPAAIPTAWTANYDYDTPNKEGEPGSGEALHANDSQGTIRFHKTDNDGTDREAALLALTPGDIVASAGMRWAVQTDPVDGGAYVEIAVAPGQQAGPDGVRAFDFETVVATPITVVVDPDFWVGNPAVTGRYRIDGGDWVDTESQYSVDLNVQPITRSPDWDFLAYTP